MDKFDLHQWLRYGLCGAIALITPIISFDSVTVAVNGVPESLLGATVVLGIALVVGALTYSLHRAILYPPFYKLIVYIVYGKGMDLEILDIKRWERYQDEESLQQNMKEWASQIHFLYCSLWAAAVPLILGTILRWCQSEFYDASLVACAVLAIGAIYLHYAYTRREYRLFGLPVG